MDPIHVLAYHEGPDGTGAASAVPEIDITARRHLSQYRQEYRGFKLEDFYATSLLEQTKKERCTCLTAGSVRARLAYTEYSFPTRQCCRSPVGDHGPDSVEAPRRRRHATSPSPKTGDYISRPRRFTWNSVSGVITTTPAKPLLHLCTIGVALTGHLRQRRAQPKDGPDGSGIKSFVRSFIELSY